MGDAPRAQADSVTVTITVDNGYGFGFGDINGIYAGQYYGGVDNCTAAQIFGSPCYVFSPPDNPAGTADTGAEIYNITAGANDYIYIISWSDDSSDQGAVASFTDNNTGTTVTTSPSWPWQVYGTGTNYRPNCLATGTHGPPLTGFSYAINNQITVANAGSGGPGTTGTWVDNTGGPNGRLDFSGQFNGNTYPFAVPSCINSGALWMEYNPEPGNPSCNPFRWGSTSDYSTITNFLREYLIYRIGPLGTVLNMSCLQVQCPTNKTVNCGTYWAFDQPIVSTCCTNQVDDGTGSLTNLFVYSTGIVTNGACPKMDVTQTWQITDACGNSTNCSQTVTVLGCCSNCLAILCQPDKTVQCGDTNWTFDPPLASTCCTSNFVTSTGTVTNVLIVPISTVTNGTCPTFITQTWSISDACGNSNVCMQTVTVMNTNGPPLSCPGDITVNSGQAWIFTPPTVQGSNLCCTNVIIRVVGTVTNISENPCEVSITRTWQAMDCCSNTSTCTQTVNILSTGPCQTFNTGVSGTNVLAGDAIDPTYALISQPVGGMATLPDAVVIYPANANSSYTSLPDTSVSQWIGPDPNADFSAAGEEPAGVYHYRVQFILCCTNGTLLSGRMAADNTAGVYLNGTFNIGFIPGFSGWTSVNASSGFHAGLNTLDIFVTNNSSSNDPGFSPTAFRAEVSICSTQLLVNCPTNKTVQCGSKWSFDLPTASSCCGTNVSIIPTGTVTNGTCPKLITQTWSISDGCGNSNVCNQTVTVVDTTPPTISCPANVTAYLNTNCQLVIPYISVTASDNCTPLCSLIYKQSPTNGTILNATNAYVTVTVTDLCGNSNSCVVLVQGIPRRGLQVTWPTSITVTNCQVPCASNYVFVSDCTCPHSSIHFAQSPPCGTVTGPGINSITVTVTDCNGNTASKVIPLNVSGNGSFLNVLTNTGISATGSVLGTGAIDPHYTLGPVPGVVAGYVPPRAIVYTNLWPWMEATHISAWIAPTATSDINSCPSGNYTYTNKFTLPAGTSLSTASISGRWAADDGAVQMYINGIPTGNTIVPTGWNHWTPFTINSGFVTGQNTILFVVTNSFLYSPSPTGFRDEYTNANVILTCAPPSNISIKPERTLQEFSTAVFSVNAGGTPPLGYQWKFNSANISGATKSTLTLPSIGYGAAGSYSVIITNPCGSVTGVVRLTVTQPLPWTNNWWNVSALDAPLSATFGSDLVLAGSNSLTGFAISAGTTEDFGLPNPGGQIVNVMNVNPAAGTGIGIPSLATAGATLSSYTLIMDLYEPGSSAGIPSTLFASDYVTNLGSGGQDGVSLTLDVANQLNINVYSGGSVTTSTGTTALALNAWNRVALVVQGPQSDGTGANLLAYANGNVATTAYNCPCCVISPATGINWNSASPGILSAQAAGAPNGEFYLSGIQLHAIAMPPQMIYSIGSPDDGPAPINSTTASAPPPLTASTINGQVTLGWTGSPYALQETDDLDSGGWEDSAAPFTESLVAGSVLTTATVDPAVNGRIKFYRLVFRP